jgi:hypothetical protein
LIVVAADQEYAPQTAVGIASKSVDVERSVGQFRYVITSAESGVPTTWLS